MTYKSYEIIYKKWRNDDNKLTLRAYNDVIDWYVNQFYKEANETHNTETDGSGNSNFLKFWNKEEKFILQKFYDAKL